MAGFLLCEPTTLYNILNQEAKYSRLAEPNYLYLLDVRTKREYDESHIITAQRMKQNGSEYIIPESMDLECVKYCIVYDGTTDSLDVKFELTLREMTESEEDEVLYPRPQTPTSCVGLDKSLHRLPQFPQMQMSWRRKWQTVCSSIFAKKNHK